MMFIARKILLFESFLALSCNQLKEDDRKNRLSGAEAPVENSSIRQDAVNVKQEELNPCPKDMKHVAGDMLAGPGDYVELIQDSTCINWISKDFPARCAEFDRTQWEKEKKKISRSKMNFCIDTYEWPNKEGADPTVFVTWVGSASLCASVGKRLCSEDEWTFACEGEEGRPYPYGYTRDSSACNIDKSWIDVDEGKLNSSNPADELRRLWQGAPSGSMPKCVSPFGVHDLTGNVDEWTASVRKTGYKSVLKGGYWSVVRNRCRPSTRAHNEGHRYYQQGFRCCSSSKKLDN